MRHPGTATVQIILNAFRLKPLDEVLPAAEAAGVGIIARVPLASGLLSGKYTADTSFAANDHRNFNRTGSAFDVGETFSGVDYEQGLQAVPEFEELVPDGVSTAQAAIAWIAAQDGVSTVIPGARTVDQVRPTRSGRGQRHRRHVRRRRPGNLRPLLPCLDPPPLVAAPTPSARPETATMTVRRSDPSRTGSLPCRLDRAA